MTEKQILAISKMNEQELRMCISRNFHKKDIVKLCEKQLERLKVDDALVEFTPLDDFGGE